MTVAKPKNKFFKMISLAKSNDYIRINRVLVKKKASNILNHSTPFLQAHHVYSLLLS